MKKFETGDMDRVSCACCGKKIDILFVCRECVGDNGTKCP